MSREKGMQGRMAGRKKVNRESVRKRGRQRGRRRGVEGCKKIDKMKEEEEK